MRLALLAVFLMMGFVSFSQNDTTKYYKSLDYGWNYQRLKARAALVIPSDTIANKLGIVQIDTSIYVGNGIRWAKAGGGAAGTTIDTTSLSNRINQKLSISDSATYYTKYRSDTSRSNIYTSINQKLSISDSAIYYTKFRSDTSRSNIYTAITNVSTNDTATVVKALVTNAEENTLQRGEVVYLYQATGNRASVKRAYNKSDATSAKTFGIVQNSIGAGQTGYVITQGQCDKLTLGSFTEGATLYLDSIAGQMTASKPKAPYHLVYVGIVERANNGNGILYVKPQNGYELDEIHDVQINSPLNNQIIAYSDTQSIWKNRNIYSVVDTTQLSNRINTKLNSSDSTTYQTKYRSDSARTNIYTSLSTKLNLSDSVTYQTKYRSDSARTNTYTAIAGKFTLPSLTSGSVLFSNGTTIAQKNANFFWDNTNNRLGLGTTSPNNTFDVVRDSAGTMARSAFESASFTYSGDAKVGIYTSSSLSQYGAGIAFGQTKLTANSRYPGFEMQYVYSSTVASNAWRVNYTERSAAGAVQNYTANVLQAYADGSVIINPTTSGVTASAKLFVGTATNAGYMLDVNGSARVNSLYYRALSTPASASATGTTGEVRIDANYIYVCTGTNTWKRAAIATW